MKTNLLGLIFAIVLTFAGYKVAEYILGNILRPIGQVTLLEVFLTIIGVFGVIVLLILATICYFIAIFGDDL